MWVGGGGEFARGGIVSSSNERDFTINSILSASIEELIGAGDGKVYNNFPQFDRNVKGQGSQRKGGAPVVASVVVVVVVVQAAAQISNRKKNKLFKK